MSKSIKEDKEDVIDPSDFRTLDARFNFAVNSNQMKVLRNIAKTRKGNPSVAMLLRQFIETSINEAPKQRNIFDVDK